MSFKGLCKKKKKSIANTQTSNLVVLAVNSRTAKQLDINQIIDLFGITYNTYSAFLYIS